MSEIVNVDIDLTGVDISRPLLPRQTLRCRTGDVRAERRDENSPRQLVIPLTLEEPGKDTNGNEVGVGFAVTGRIQLDATGKLTQAMINERVARFQIAVTKADKPGRLVIEELSGREVMVTFDVRVDKQDPSKVYQDVKSYYAVRS